MIGNWLYLDNRKVPRLVLFLSHNFSLAFSPSEKSIKEIKPDFASSVLLIKFLWIFFENKTFSSLKYCLFMKHS